MGTIEWILILGVQSFLFSSSFWCVFVFVSFFNEIFIYESDCTLYTKRKAFPIILKSLEMQEE